MKPLFSPLISPKLSYSGTSKWHTDVIHCDGFYPEDTSALSVYWLKWKITLNNPSYHIPPLSRLKTAFHLCTLQFSPQLSLSSQWPVITQGSYRNPLAEEHNTLPKARGNHTSRGQLNCDLHCSSSHTVRIKHFSAITSMTSLWSIHNTVKRRRKHTSKTIQVPLVAHTWLVTTMMRTQTWQIFLYNARYNFLSTE